MAAAARARRRWAHRHCDAGSVGGGGSTVVRSFRPCRGRSAGRGARSGRAWTCPTVQGAIPTPAYPGPSTPRGRSVGSCSQRSTAVGPAWICAAPGGSCPCARLLCKKVVDAIWFRRFPAHDGRKVAWRLASTCGAAADLHLGDRCEEDRGSYAVARRLRCRARPARRGRRRMRSGRPHRRGPRPGPHRGARAGPQSRRPLLRRWPERW